MPRKLGRVRSRGKSFFFRHRVGGKDQTVKLPSDPDMRTIRIAELRQRIKDGLPLKEEPKPEPKPQPKFTVEDLVRAWLRDRVAHTRRGLFRLITERRAEQVLIPFMGSMAVDEVKASTLFAFKSFVAKLPGRKEATLGSGAIRAHLGDLRSALNHGLVLGVLDRSPVPREGWLPKKSKDAPAPFTDAERATLKALPGDVGRVLRLALSTGMRWGELSRAQASDVQGGKLLVPISKSGHHRRIPLPADVLAECRGRVGKLCPWSDVVSYNRMVRKLSGIEGFRSHRCRDDRAHTWLADGGSLAALAEFFGHASVTTTEVYSTISEDMLEREAARVFGLETGPKMGQVAMGES